MNSIHWCFYGEERVQNKIDTKEGDEGIVNKQVFKKLGLGKTEETFVEIYIYKDDHPQFHIKRSIITMKNSDNGTLRNNETNAALTPTNFSLEEKLEFEEWDDESEQLISSSSKENAKNRIHSNFPRDVSEYLLFDAELLTDFEKNKSGTLVKKGIDEITGLPVLLTAVKNFSKVLDKFEDEAGEGDSEYKALLGRKRNLQEIIEESGEGIERAKEKIMELQEKNKEINRKLLASGEDIVNEKEATRATSESAKKDNEEDLKEATEQQSKLIHENLWKFFLEKTFDNAKKKFDKMEEEGDIPPTVGKDAYEKIINNSPHECVICGTTIEEGTELWEKLKTKSENTIDNASLREITLGRKRIDYILADIEKGSEESLKKKWKGLENRISQYTEKIKEHDGKINEIDRYLNKIDKNNISELNKERSDNGSIIDELLKEQGKLETQEEGAQNKLTEMGPKLAALEKTVEKTEHDQSLTSISKASKVLCKMVNEELSNDFKSIAEKKTWEFFKTFAPRKQDFGGVKVMNNYVLRALSREEEGKLPKNVSAGQAHALGLSFLTAIRQIMKMNYFMIVDSPLHNISQQERNGFVDLCVDVAPQTQTTLFVTDGEYTSIVKKKITGGDVPSVRDHLIKNGTLYREYILDVVCDKCGELSDEHTLVEDGGDHEPISRTKIRYDDGSFS